MTYDHDCDRMLGQRGTYPPFKGNVNLIKSLIQE